MARIGVPITSRKGVSSKVGDHFAMSEDFAILEVEGGEIVSMEIAHVARHGEAKTAEFLADKGVDVVLAGRIGPCMTRIFNERGVKMFSGAGGTVKDAFESYKAGALTEILPNPYQI